MTRARNKEDKTDETNEAAESGNESVMPIASPLGSLHRSAVQAEQRRSARAPPPSPFLPATSPITHRFEHPLHRPHTKHNQRGVYQYSLRPGSVRRLQTQTPQTTTVPKHQRYSPEDTLVW
uniref:Uncharacterized protein n=1 Tax=Plectus sambesii TaxID=2011161 RepID=A0A914ULL8_9BILA